VSKVLLKVFNFLEPLAEFRILRAQKSFSYVQHPQLRNAMTKMLDLDSNWEGVGKQEFPLAELFKPRGLKAQRSEQ